MQKVRWGIMGTANIARGCTIPGMKIAESCELYAIAGRSLEKAEAFKEEYGFEKAYGSYAELLDDEMVQAVYIPLPNNLHLEWVKAALAKKKHVLCEKPLALNAAEAREMYQTAKDNGVYLMEAYAYLHSPYVESLKKDAMLIGEIDYIDTAFVTQNYKEDFRLHKELGGGAMYDLGCYCTTMILSLINSDPVFVKASAEFSDKDGQELPVEELVEAQLAGGQSVKAQLAESLPVANQQADNQQAGNQSADNQQAGNQQAGAMVSTNPGVDLMTSAAIRFRNGARATFDVGMLLGKNTNARYDRLFIHGSNGSIRSDVEYNQSGEVKYKVFTADGVIERIVSVPQNYSLEIEQLSRCILGEDTPFITPEFSIKNAELMDRVFEEIGY